MKRMVKRVWRRWKQPLLYASIIAPLFLGVVFLDVWFKHPWAAMLFWLGQLGWDICFLVANGKPRQNRGFQHTHTKDLRMATFTQYVITSDGEGQERREA